MKTASRPLHTDKSNDSLIANLYGPESESQNALREFLESSGITVHVNSPHQENGVYTIIVGDQKSVKDITESYTFTETKVLYVLVGESQNHLTIALPSNVKAVCIDAGILKKETVKKIFSFFFTDSSQLIDLTTHTLKTPIAEVKPETPYTPEISRQVLPKSIPLSRADAYTQTDTPEIKLHEDANRIEQTIKDVYGEEQTKNIKKSHTRFNLPRIRIWKYIIFVLVLCIAPMIWYFASLVNTTVFLYIGANSVEKGNITSSDRELMISRYWLSHATGTLTLMKVPLHLVFQEKILRNQEQLLSFISDMSDAMGAIVQSGSVGKKFLTSMTAQLSGITNGTESTAKIIDQLKTQLPYIHDRLGLASAQLSYLIHIQAFPFYNQFILLKGTHVLDQLETVQTRIGDVQNLLTLYSAIGGFDQGKTYLLLLQNSMELRPTGGFIGSIGLASVHDGLLTDLKIQDVYEVDGQLKGHSDPPKPIREILGQEHWYLRDSNWNPDFQVSGMKAAWFYEKETNVQVDGVIALSSPFIIDILRATGPIDLADYNDRITADNFYGKSFYYTQNNFFPGSTQKKDFLGSLITAISLKVTHEDGVNQAILIQAIQHAFASHAIQMYFPRQDLQQLVEQFGWTGTVGKAKECMGTLAYHTCVDDFFHSVEANLSVNKVNYFMTRTRLLQVDFQNDHTVSHTVTQEFSNNSEGKNGEGGGNYRNYQRFYIPADAQINEILINGENISVRNPASKEAGMIPYAEFDTSDQSASGSSTILGLAFDVRPSEKVVIVLSYVTKLPGDESGQSFVYELRQPVQPGIGDSMQKTIIRTPLSWNVKAQNPPERISTLANQSQLEYNNVSTKDDVIRLTIQNN